MFDYVYDEIDVNKKSTLNKALCRDVVIFNDYENCTAYVVNSCSNIGRVISTIGKMEACGGEFDEIILDAPLDPDECPDGYEEDVHGICVAISNGGSSDSDSSSDPDDPNDPDTGGCDEMDYDCDTGGGSDGDQQTDKLNTDNLNTTQKQLLDQAIIELQNNCLGKVLYNSINTVVNIEVDQTTSYATYTGISNTIRFNTNNDIYAGSLGSELFHAYQQQLYGILDDIQTDLNHVGGSNIEFEEKAFNMLNERFSTNDEPYDPLEGTGTHLIVEDLQGETYDGTGSLGFWLSDILANHPNGNITLNQSELNKWLSSLDSFQKNQPQNCGDMYCAPIDIQLKPNAIISLLNKYFNSDCK